MEPLTSQRSTRGRCLTTRRRLGSRTIKHVAGRGRDLRVQVEFDDESVGLKQLLAAYAGLEKEWE